MNDLRKTAQAALEALISTHQGHWPDDAPELIDALRAALAEPQPVPVAWRYQDARGNFRYRAYKPGFDVEYAILKPIALYAHP